MCLSQERNKKYAEEFTIGNCHQLSLRRGAPAFPTLAIETIGLGLGLGIGLGLGLGWLGLGLVRVRDRVRDSGCRNNGCRNCGMYLPP